MIIHDAAKYNASIKKEYHTTIKIKKSSRILSKLNFCSMQGPVKRIKKQATDGRQYLQIKAFIRKTEKSN